MTGRLLAQVAWVALRDSDATRDDDRERERLRVLSLRLAYKAREAGFLPAGLDYVFGEEGDE